MLLINIGSTSCGGNVVRVNGVSKFSELYITLQCSTNNLYLVHTEISSYHADKVCMRRDRRQDLP